MARKAKSKDLNFTAQVKAVTKAQVQKRAEELNKGFDERAAFEALHAPANSSIQEKIKACRRKLLIPTVTTMTIVTDIDPDFMNKAMVHASKRFNVYAIDKLADLLKALDTGVIQKAVNKAIVTSLFRFDAAGVQFTGVAAQGAVSDKLRLERKIAALLLRHTASPGTAPTQASSTMNALLTMNVVRNTGSQKHPIWQLTDAPVVERLRAIAA